jgi:tRNA threonylcarbamoyladenosine biosynthesis protein TsaE
VETAYTLSELKPIAKQIIAQWKHPILLLEAAMGAGKTTLIKALCAELGVPQAVSSPTFSLVNSYEDSNGNALYHFDLYRLNSLEEALDIGVEEYLDSGARCMIEWPKHIRPLLPDAFHQIHIEPLGANTRKLIFDA